MIRHQQSRTVGESVLQPNGRVYVTSKAGESVRDQSVLLDDETWTHSSRTHHAFSWSTRWRKEKNCCLRILHTLPSTPFHPFSPSPALPTPTPTHPSPPKKVRLLQGESPSPPFSDPSSDGSSDWLSNTANGLVEAFLGCGVSGVCGACGPPSESWSSSRAPSIVSTSNATHFFFLVPC